MTGPQRELLEVTLEHERLGLGPIRPRGAMLRVAENLKRAGLVELRIGGSGIPWTAPWWYEIVVTEKGRIASGACD